jgi:hypothetical protein
MPQFILSDSMNIEIKAIRLQDELSKPVRNILHDNPKKTINNNNNKRKVGYKPIITKTNKSGNSTLIVNPTPIINPTTIVNKPPDNKPLIF